MLGTAGTYGRCWLGKSRKSLSKARDSYQSLGEFFQKWDIPRSNTLSSYPIFTMINWRPSNIYEKQCPKRAAAMYRYQSFWHILPFIIHTIWLHYINSLIWNKTYYGILTPNHCSRLGRSEVAIIDPDTIVPTVHPPGPAPRIWSSKVSCKRAACSVARSRTPDSARMRATARGWLM